MAVACLEGCQILVHYILSLSGKDFGDSLAYSLVADIQHGHGSSQKDHIGGLCRSSGLLGKGLHIQHYRMGQSFQMRIYLFLVRIIRDIDKGLRRRYHPTVQRQFLYIAQCLHRLERHDNVHLAVRDKVTVDRIGGDAQVALYVASALAHSVNLGLLDMQPVGKGRFSKYRSDGEDSLSSHTGQYYIFLHIGF